MSNLLFVLVALIAIVLVIGLVLSFVFLKRK